MDHRPSAHVQTRGLQGLCLLSSRCMSRGCGKLRKKKVPGTCQLSVSQVVLKVLHNFLCTTLTCAKRVISDLNPWFRTLHGNVELERRLEHAQTLGDRRVHQKWGKGRRQLIDALPVTYSRRKTVKLSNRLALGRATGIRVALRLLVLPTKGLGCYHLGEEPERHMKDGTVRCLSALQVLGTVLQSPGPM